MRMMRRLGIALGLLSTLAFYQNCRSFRASESGGDASATQSNAAGSAADGASIAVPDPGLPAATSTGVPVAPNLPSPTPVGIAKLTAYRVMPLGDSITAGVGDSDSGVGYRGPLYDALLTDGYAVTMVGEHDPADPRLANEGNPGWTIEWSDIYAVSGASGSIATYHPDVAIVLLGTNDIEQQADLTNAAPRMLKLITDIRVNAPEIRLIICSIPPLADQTLNNQVNTLNASLSALVVSEKAAGRAVAFADVNAALTVADLSQDGIHPNHGGYQKIAATLQRAFAANF